jgi:hypothetical protein
MDVLLKRLERAERVSRIVGAALAVVTGGFLIFLATAATSSTLTTRTLSIVDGSGHERIKLSTTGGRPYIHMIDANGKTRVALYLGDGEEKPALEFLSATDKPVAWLYENPTAPGGTLHVYDGDGNNRAALGISTEGYPSLWLMAPDGKTAQTNMYVNNNGAEMQLYDRSGTRRMYLGWYTDETYGMEFDDASGTQIWKRP